MSPAEKHGPNRFGNYESVHEACMQRFRDEGFVVDDTLEFQPIEGASVILLSGEIRCLGGIVIEVTKTLAIVGGERRNAMVQTESYTYHACIRGVGNILRYCSGHPDHNQDHHVHRYDLLRGDRRSITTLHGASGWPTLGDVIEEVRDWYFANQGQADALAASAGPIHPSDESDDL